MRKYLSIVVVWLLAGESILCGQYIPFPGPGKRVPPGISIALDTSLDLGNGSTGTITTAYTTSGTNRMLFVACEAGGNILTGITYNGVALTAVNSETTVRNFWLYALENPAVGAHNVVVSSSAGTDIGCVGASFTGVNQTGQPYTQAANTATGLASGASFTISLTTTVNNDWIIGGFTNNVGCTFNTAPGFTGDVVQASHNQLLLLWGVQATAGANAPGVGLSGCGTWSVGGVNSAITHA